MYLKQVLEIPYKLLGAMDRGSDKQLRTNLQGQLSRLLTQLKDLEELKEELDVDEYEQTKSETLAQLQEFEQSLGRIAAGNTTLEDDISSMKLALQTAIAQAFQTPEVIKMFKLRQPAQLRERLSMLERDVKLGRIPEKQASQESLEILMALQKLGDPLSASEKARLHSSFALPWSLEAITVDEGKVEGRVLSMANSGLQGNKRSNK